MPAAAPPCAVPGSSAACGPTAGSRSASGASLKALHETGHMLGIPHCIDYECCFNGANHLAEMDSQPLYLCPEDAAKICWACSADRKSRYARLLEFAQRHNLTDEAKYWQ